MTDSETALEYLLAYLTDEFRTLPQVRLRRTPVRSKVQGVVARTEAREYFFPVEWVRILRMDKVTAEVSRVREGLGL